MSTVSAYNEIESLSQESIIVRYAPMVKRIAHHLIGRLPKNIQVDDLIQAGMIGLLEAASKYDTSKGASFETYAGIRIRGTMLDEVRKNDWVPRSVYRNTRNISEVVRVLENKLGRDARDTEIAEAMQISLEEYHQMLSDANMAQVHAFEDLGIPEENLNSVLLGTVPGPMEGVQKDKFFFVLSESIKKLPEREQLVLSLYYDEELNLKEIGEILDVSESRVCQIHTQAMLRLRARISMWK